MRQIIVFGTKEWPTCEPTKEYLSEQNVEFLYLDIMENMRNLKIFLKYRDNHSEFDQVKKSGSIGIPCIVVNRGEEIIFDYNELEI